MAHKILADLSMAQSRSFGRETVNIGHWLSESPLFSDDSLAKLIEASDVSSCHVNTMDVHTHDPRTRREGIIDGLSGAEALEAVRRGHIWILLQNPDRIDGQYRELLRAIYDELEANIGGLKTFRQKMSLLISSPNVQVYYHADVPGQTLWQIRGTKRVWIYPNREPFLSQAALERIVLGEAHEISLDYSASFDEDAVMMRLEPGRMVHWPLNCPHRVVNDNSLNVSFTTEHWTRDLRNAYAVNYANGLLRRTFGLGDRCLARPSSGVGLYTRLGLAAVHKSIGAGRRRAQKFKIDFRLDPDSPEGVQQIAAYAITK